MVDFTKQQKQQQGNSSDEDEEPENLQYKVVVLGNGTVGKTSLINRFINDDFAKSYKQTTGLDFFLKRLELPGNINVSLQVWDIGGQSIFQKTIPMFIHDANAVSKSQTKASLRSLTCLRAYLGHADVRYNKSTVILGS